MRLAPDRCALIGMVHLPPLPGSPGWGGAMGPVLEAARRDARALVEGGCDALLVENMGDLPFLRGRVEPETVAAAALCVSAVAELGRPVGVQLLAAANREALGVAVAAGASFVRVEAFAYAHVADEGWLDACAGDLLRARRALGADVQVWADVKKKHAAHAVTADLDLGEAARGAAFCGADALVVTGARTGAATAPADLEAAKLAGLPVVVGSGVTDDDAPALAPRAQGVIVGTWLKEEGDWRRPVDPARVRALRQALDAVVRGAGAPP
ncbi:MAG: BtpA/SgcQ family protein [Planctomycetes bacterium]|nr:BtpA/SgcQ family protein [Planctomycetota bacterium]